MPLAVTPTRRRQIKIFYNFVWKHFTIRDALRSVGQRTVLHARALQNKFELSAHAWQLNKRNELYAAFIHKVDPR